jgi:predicted transcriptional regulator
LEDGVVTVVTTKEEYDADRSEKYIAESFSGSLPAFIAAFTKKKSLTEEEIAEIRAMIDGAGRE